MCNVPPALFVHLMPSKGPLRNHPYPGAHGSKAKVNVKWISRIAHCLFAFPAFAIKRMARFFNCECVSRVLLFEIRVNTPECVTCGCEICYCSRFVRLR